MFEHMTFDFILGQMLDRVPNDVDKREGSIIYDALAPTAMELAETYSNMDVLLLRTYAATADGADLDKRVEESGVFRKQASAAIRRGVFTDREGLPFKVPKDSRFQVDGLVFTVQDEIELGNYRLLAMVPGAIGNQVFGEMVPLEDLNGLGAATLTDVLIPGEDDESDESLYEKYQDHINDVAFGGNRADYKQKVLGLQGVGGVQLFRAPRGGGTSGVRIIDSEFNVPSPELIAYVQEKMDPEVNSGDGFGLAPIGHTVLVSPVEDVPVTFSAELSLSDLSIGQVEPLIEAVIEEYLLELRKMWNRGLPLTVRLSQMESRILDIEGVEDIFNATLNGALNNLVLPEEVPVFSEVVLNEQGA